MDVLKECPYCKIPYYAHVNVVCGVVRSVWLPNCNCEINKYKREQQQRESEAIRNALEKRFKNSLLTPLLQKANFEDLDDTEVKSECINFVKNFDPLTSRGFAFIGNIGRGKTTLLACVTNELIAKGFNCLFINLTILLDKFMETMSFTNFETAQTLLYWLCQFDFIVFDDFGAESFSDKRVEFLRLIIDHLVVNEKCLSFTANPEKLAVLQDEEYKYFNDFAAIFDRLSQLCPSRHIFVGGSYRRSKQQNLGL